MQNPHPRSSKGPSRWLKTVVLAALTASLPLAASESVPLAWNTNPEPDIREYLLHIGNRSGEFTEVRPLGNTTRTVVHGLAPQTTYYFALQAVNDDGLRSTLSEEISHTTGTSVRPVLTVGVPGEGVLESGTGSLPFGPVDLAEPPRQQSLVLANQGNATLTGLAVEILGSHPEDFTVSALATHSLPAGAWTAIQIAFRPRAAGARDAILRISTNHADHSPFEISLTGSGTTKPSLAITGPQHEVLSPSGAAIQANTVRVGETGGSGTFTIRNHGSGILGPISATVTGLHAGDFAVSPFPYALAPGGQATFGVIFRPSAAGSRSATLKITSNDLTHTPFEIALGGTGLGVPQIAIHDPLGKPLVNNGSGLGFGSATVGQSAAPLALSLHNTGSAILGGVRATILGPHAEDFSVSQIPLILAVGRQTGFEIGFRPSSPGSHSATLRITSTDPAQPVFDIPLGGTGLGVPQIAIHDPLGKPLVNNGSGLGFGSTTVGQSAAPLALSLHNTGSAILGGVRTTILGPHAADFSVSQIPLILAAGRQAGFELGFRPSAPGSRSATLRVTSTDPTQPVFDLPLGGIGLGVPQIAIYDPLGTPLENLENGLSFGSTTVGQSAAPLALNLHNTGSAILGGVRATILGPHAADFSVSQIPLILAVGGQAGFELGFRPSSPGSRSATLRVTSTDPAQPVFDIPLGGTGLGVPQVAIYDPLGKPLENLENGLNFGSATVGQSAAPLALSLHNTGSAILGDVRATIHGPHAADFSVSQIPLILAPGWQADFSVTYRPGAPGSRSATLRVTSTDPARPVFDIPLSGLASGAPRLAISRTDGEAMDIPAKPEQFGVLQVGAASLDTRYRLANPGSLPATGLRFTMFGRDAADFTVSAPGTATLAVAGTVEFGLVFRPLGEGSRAAVLVISGDSPANSLILPLAGVGSIATVPALEVVAADGTAILDESPLDFGTRREGDRAASQVILLRNSGNAPVTGLDLRLEGDRAGAFAILSAIPSKLPPGESAEIVISFHPPAPGIQSAALHIVSDQPAAAGLRLHLSGALRAAPRPALGVAESSNTLRDAAAVIRFGNSSGQSVRVFTITNHGDAPLTGLRIATGGLHPRDFRILRTPPRSLAPGQSANIRIAFHPRHSGNRWAKLRVISSDPDHSHFRVILAGSATPDQTAGNPGPDPSQSAVKRTLVSRTVIDGQRYRTLTIPKIGGRSVSLGRVEVSTNLVDWQSGPRHVTVITDNPRFLMVRDNTPITPQNKRHIRLRPVR